MKWMNPVLLILMIPNQGWTLWGSKPIPIHVCANNEMRMDGRDESFEVPLENDPKGYQLSSPDLVVYDHAQSWNPRKNFGIISSDKRGSIPVDIDAEFVLRRLKLNKYKVGRWVDETADIVCFFNVELGAVQKLIDAPAKNLINPRLESATVETSRSSAPIDHPMLTFDVEGGIGGKPAQYVCEMRGWIDRISYTAQNFLDAINARGVFKQAICPALMEKVEEQDDKTVDSVI